MGRAFHVDVESRVDDETLADLERRGHEISRLGDWSYTVGGGQGRTDGKRHGGDGIHGHAHQGNDHVVVGHGPHGHAPFGSADKLVQGQHQAEGDQHDHDLLVGHIHTTDVVGGRFDKLGKF